MIRIKLQSLIKLEKKNRYFFPIGIVFLFTVYNGILRKWVISSSTLANIIMGLQLLMPIYFSTAYIKFNNFKYIPLQNTYRYYFVALCFMAFNPYNHTFYHGFFGLLLHSTIWMILIAYLRIQNHIKLKYLDVPILITFVIQFVISYLQYILPGDHVLNLFSNGNENNANVGDAIRASGTFSYLGGLQGFMIFWAFFAWYYATKNKNTLITAMIFILGFLCALFTGSRGVMVYYAVISILALYYTKFLIHKKTQLLSIIVAYLIISFFIPQFSIIDKFKPAYENFEKRFEKNNQSGEMDKRVSNQFMGAFTYHGNNEIFGVGLGSTYQGANLLFGTSQKVIDYGYLEDEGERIVVEGGYLLYIWRLIIFVIFISHLSFPKFAKLIIFLMFFNAMLTFNIYIGIFFALGLIWLDNAYFKNITQ